jgi:hypothetical protein
VTGEGNCTFYCVGIWKRVVVPKGGTMNETIVRTWNLLPSLGFERNSSDTSRLSLNLGNLSLSVVEAWSPRSGSAVFFNGILATPRTISEVEFALPRQIESLKQCAAWIVWNLDQHADGKTFRAARQVDWIDEARQNRRLLPWVLSQAEFNARPQCTVGRDWLRLTLRMLREQLTSLPDNAIVTFSFDGTVFSIRCDSKVIVCPGEGSPWTVCFRVEAKTLRQQSKRRLMREYIGVSIWNSRVELGPWSYGGTLEPLGACNSSSVQ